jgi:hypothetical protein
MVNFGISEIYQKWRLEINEFSDIPKLRAGDGAHPWELRRCRRLWSRRRWSGGALDLVLAEWFREPSPLHVVYPQSRHLSRRVRVFVDWLAALISEHDGIQLRSTLREVAAR